MKTFLMLHLGLYLSSILEKEISPCWPKIKRYCVFLCVCVLSVVTDLVWDAKKKKKST